MDFSLPDILKVIGPAASIIFAAWIFMGFLQQRYDAVVERYRSIIGEFRTGEISDQRRQISIAQLRVYKRRCALMTGATLVGLVSAMMLLLCLVTAEANLILPDLAALKYISAASVWLGFISVMIAAALVVVETVVSQRQLTDELLDVPDLAHLADGKTEQDRQSHRGSWLAGWADRYVAPRS